MERDPVLRAGRIIRDATEVDWSREPSSEYEGAIRAALLEQQLALGSFGWIAILSLAFDRPDLGRDLRAAHDQAVRLLEARVAAYDFQALYEARATVERARP